jgi:diguanylate cyclase (GGDEF)-like protein
VSQSTLPNSSSDGARAAPGAPPAAGAGEELRALIRRLAEEFGCDSRTLGQVASLFAEVRERAPDLFVPAPGALAPVLTGIAGGGDAEPVHAALGEWALDAEAEPIERMRRDCLRFQNAMTRGALRLHGANPEECAQYLVAVQRFAFLQVALLASLSARGQAEGGVVRTLPTPEYAAFMEIFRTAIESHKQEGRQLALLLIEIGRVEQVDRLLGLQRGEAFMLRVTRRMREGVLRKQDQLGRVSRDQLACLLPQIAGEGVAILAANKILAALEAPVPIGEQSFSPDAAIGIAVYPEDGEDSQALVRNGKLAVRAARATAERVAAYDPEHAESEALTARYEARLRHALEQGGLELDFEPQLDLRSGKIGALVAAVRWKDAELGAVPETRALAAADASGLARELTWWVFNNGLRLYAEISRAGLQVPLVLKVVPGGLLQPDFSDFVGRALRTWGIAPGRLIVEIHETALAGALDQVQEKLAALKGHGLRLGIDGFGTGSSSLANLAQLPLDELKLGAAFVADMRQTPAHAKVVRSLAQLGRDLGLRVVADGVADAETALALSTLGCERIQGDYVSPPLPARDVLASAGEMARVPLRPPQA